MGQWRAVVSKNNVRNNSLSSTVVVEKEVISHSNNIQTSAEAFY